MNKFFIAVGLGLLSVSAMANTSNFKTLPDEKATFELCESAAKAFNTKEMDFKSVSNILEPYWKYGEINPSKSLALTNYENEQMVRLGLPLWGAPVDTVFLTTDKDKSGYFVRHNFMMRRANLGLKFYCDFYKGSNNWHLVGLKWHDNYQTFFE